jgi:hypothetical protein
MISLASLPEDHPDRNRLLAGCFYRWSHGKEWREIMPSFLISHYTYNQLGKAWIDNDIFSWSYNVC